MPSSEWAVVRKLPSLVWSPQATTRCTFKYQCTRLHRIYLVQTPLWWTQAISTTTPSFTRTYAPVQWIWSKVWVHLHRQPHPPHHTLPLTWTCTPRVWPNPRCQSRWLPVTYSTARHTPHLVPVPVRLQVNNLARWEAMTWIWLSIVPCPAKTKKMFGGPGNQATNEKCPPRIWSNCHYPSQSWDEGSQGALANVIS